MACTENKCKAIYCVLFIRKTVLKKDLKDVNFLPV